jgi:putative regulator of septum formation
VNARRVGIGLAILGLVAALSGCARPAGTDGNLTDDWKPWPAAKLQLPPVGACYDTTLEDAYHVAASDLKPVESCAAPHAAETVYVGQFTGAAAGREGPPPNDGPDTRAAYGECAKGAQGYLGDVWQAGRLYLLYSPPTLVQWQGGRRYFRCDLVEIKSEQGALVKRTGTARDGLRGARPLAIACVNFVGETKDSFDDLTRVDCATAHRAEFAGVFAAADVPYPANADDRDKLGLDGCQQVVARFLNITSSALNQRSDLTWIYWGLFEDSWPLGDRTARCYVGVPANHPVKGTLKGLGNRALP